MKPRRERYHGWLVPTLAVGAFVGLLAAFALELASYRNQVVEWAQRDLDSRTGLAAANLAKPLQTQDFPRVRELGGSLLADGYRLTVLSANGHGRVYDAQGGAPDTLAAAYSSVCGCGDYQIRLSISRDRVLAPFRRARLGFVLAALLGMMGVSLFFAVIYRQRVRIRELARVERFRREFVADVSHEIKTPLTGILGAVDLMEGMEVKVKGEGEGERRRCLFLMIKREAKRLNALVQSILDLARLEREGIVLHSVETDLAELVREVAERFGVTADAGRFPRLLVRVDPQLVEQALSNLVENAKRHSGSSEISLSVDRSGTAIRIAVEDHGIGIPIEHVGQIFERFHRVDPARAAETGGAGLGLAIVRQIARLHGGDVVYRPAVPHGSVFTLILPVRK